jgi:hypothetical protein
MATTTLQFNFRSSEEKSALDDLCERIKKQQLTTCQELKKELNKFSNLDRPKWPSFWTSPLEACVEADDVQLIQTCLDNSIKIDSSGNIGRTALYNSIDLIKSESMKLLLDQGAEVTIRHLALAFWRSEAVFQELCATLEAKHGLNSHGLDLLARIVQLLKCPSAVTQTSSEFYFEETLIRSLSVCEAVLHVGFKSCDGQIDSVHKAVQWLSSRVQPGTEGYSKGIPLYHLCAIAIKENCKDSQDLLLKEGVVVSTVNHFYHNRMVGGKKAFTQEEFYIMNINSDQNVRQF